MSELDKNKKRDTEQSENRNHPEQYPTDKESLFDLHEDMQHVDPIPIEDQHIEKQDEKVKEETKNSSSSPKKYHSGFE